MSDPNGLKKAIREMKASILYHMREHTLIDKLFVYKVLRTSTWIAGN
jgi:hypothetical protein